MLEPYHKNGITCSQDRMPQFKTAGRWRCDKCPKNIELHVDTRRKILYETKLYHSSQYEHAMENIQHLPEITVNVKSIAGAQYRTTRH